MIGPRIRTQVAFLLFILLPAAGGVFAVHASPTCQRFVKTYVTKPVKNTVRRETAAAWAAWRLKHPNWKPNPSAHRPKYVMTREESLEKVDFACTVEQEPTPLGLLLTANLEAPPPIITLPPMDSTQISFPDEIPPEVSEVTPDNSWPLLGPFVPPILGGPPSTSGIPATPPPIVLGGGGEVPEPASFLLVATALGLLLAAKTRREGKGKAA